MSEWPARHASTAAELQARLAAERAAQPFLEMRDGDGVQHLVPLLTLEQMREAYIQRNAADSNAD